MNCEKCGSDQMFNRNKFVLCLTCGAAHARPKVGPSVTDLQLQIKALQAENDKMRAVLTEIDTYDPPGELTPQWYVAYMRHVGNLVRAYFEGVYLENRS